MINYQYPTTRELIQINPEKIQLLTRERPTFNIFPITESEFWTLEWEIRDNFRGFQQLRGLNGEPSYVKMVGWKSFSAQPGVYGEFMTVDERMMTLRAQEAGPNNIGPVNIDDLVTQRQDYLNNREIDLIEYIHWKALLDAQFTITGPTGAIYTDQFTIQNATFSDWSDHANATPLADFMGLKTLSSGKSVSFGTGALAIMNTPTLTHLLMNRNAADLGGQLAIASGGSKPIKSLPEVNTLLNSMNLPSILEYDEGYFAEPSGTFTKWLPDDTISIIGKRTNGDRLGEYRMVRNANNTNFAPGRYEKVIDRGEDRVPRIIEVHRGHNGGLVIYYGSAIVKASA